MRLQQEIKDIQNVHGFIGKNMFNKDFVMALSHHLASKYFPKRDDLLFYDKEEAYSLAKRVCINALQRGISVDTLENFAKDATSAEAFNNYVARYFNCRTEERTRKRAYIILYKKEKEVLSKVFGLDKKDIENIAWGNLSRWKIERLYTKLENYAYLIDSKLSFVQSTPDTIIKLLSMRWGLDYGLPLSIRAISCEMGISDRTNFRIKILMHEILDALLEQAKRKKAEVES